MLSVPPPSLSMSSKQRWAAAVAVFGERYPNYRLSLPFQPMLLFGQAITLLLTMRTAPSCVESN